MYRFFWIYKPGVRVVCLGMLRRGMQPMRKGDTSIEAPSFGWNGMG